MSTKKTDNPEQEKPEDKKPTCGVIMPISAIGGLSEGHWLDVRNILYEVIKEAGFIPNMVSDSPEVGVIHGRIMNNIYTNEIVVCDVSEHNPNVMLELGLRLAFDKPVIIVKDYETKFNFDTSPIEHIGYPRDLRYSSIEDFKVKLKSKIVDTYDKAKADPKYSPFLGHFKIYEASKLETKEASAVELIQSFAQEIRNELKTLKFNNSPQTEIITSRGRIRNYSKVPPEIQETIVNEFIELRSQTKKTFTEILNDKALMEGMVNGIHLRLYTKNIMVSPNTIQEIIEAYLNYTKPNAE